MILIAKLFGAVSGKEVFQAFIKLDDAEKAIKLIAIESVKEIICKLLENFLRFNSKKIILIGFKGLRLSGFIVEKTKKTNPKMNNTSAKIEKKIMLVSNISCVKKISHRSKNIQQKTKKQKNTIVPETR